MKKLQTLFFALLLLVSVTSCFTLEHTVGDGAQGSSTVSKRQWSALFGLVPISEVDSKAMAGGATDYTIKSQFTFVDQLIGIFTGIVTIRPQTVTVTK